MPVTDAKPDVIFYFLNNTLFVILLETYVSIGLSDSDPMIKELNR